jgi:hypothetical protein
MCGDEILKVLTRFHRQTFLPDFERVLDERVGPVALRGEMLSHFDTINRRFDRLEDEFVSWRMS